MFRNLKKKRTLHTPEEVGKLMDNIQYYCPKIVHLGVGAEYKTFEAYKAVNGWKSLNFTAVVLLKDTQLEITTRYGSEWLKPCTYVFDLNEESISIVTGHQAFAEFSKHLKIPKAEEYNWERLDKWYNKETGKYSCSAKPILDYSRKYNNIELSDCYEYDINSAYFNTLLEMIPDLNHPIISDELLIVGENQVGFLLNDDLKMMETGNYAHIAFNLIPTPDSLKQYCEKWYRTKSQAKLDGNEELKLTAKAYLNLPIGYCQRYNPFLRAYVVHNCNKLIANIIDEDTLFWNTDAIFSKRRREDLTIGTEIGQFKEIECRKIRYKGNVYQIDDDIPVYRGIPKKWFEAFELEHGRKFNLLEDEPPERNNIWKWNWETLTLERNKLYE